MVTTGEVLFRYTRKWGQITFIRVASVRFWSDIQEITFPPLLRSEGKSRAVRCRYGSNDWNEDGRWLGEYCCASCGQYIQVFEKKD